jgi:hypothetical protein
MTSRKQLLFAAALSLAAPLTAFASPLEDHLLLSARGQVVEHDADRATATDAGTVASRSLLSYASPAKRELRVAQLGSRDAYVTADHAPASSAALHRD